jgi:hypothetical protein
MLRTCGQAVSSSARASSGKRCRIPGSSATSDRRVSAPIRATPRSICTPENGSALMSIRLRGAITAPCNNCNISVPSAMKAALKSAPIRLSAEAVPEAAA